MGMKRDSKDPMPNALNTKRQNGDGNTPVTGEDHSQGKAEHVKEDARYTLRTGGESQPTRMNGDGNVPVTGEMHDSKKAERVSADRRW